MSTDWLAELAPAHAPPPPSWWPPAVGWWLLGAGGLLALAALWWWRRQWLRGATRRAALAELAQIRLTETDTVAIASAVQRLLRRYALHVFGAERVARESGAAWLELLREYGGSGFAGAAGQAFLDAVYGGRDAPADLREGWLTAAETFLRKAEAVLTEPAGASSREAAG